MNINITTEAMEIKMELSAEQAQNIINYALGVLNEKATPAAQPVFGKIETPDAAALKIEKTEAGSEQAEGESEQIQKNTSIFAGKPSILPQKPYTFRPGSRNEHLFGGRMGGRSEAAPQERPARPHRDYGKEGYKGFLAIKCESCGDLSGFFSKYPLTYHRCKNCGSTTDLKGLKPMFVKCKCGREYKYRTNMWEQYFDFNCLDCGAPVTLELNEKKGVYNTI